MTDTYLEGKDCSRVQRLGHNLASEANKQSPVDGFPERAQIMVVIAIELQAAQCLEGKEVPGGLANSKPPEQMDEAIA